MHHVKFLSLMVLVISTSITTANEDKIEYPCDIVVLVDCSTLSTFGNELATISEFIQRLPNNFHIGEKHTRVAVITFPDPNIELNFTSDAGQLRSAQNLTRRSKPEPQVHVALKEIKDNVFDDARPEALKIVMITTSGYWSTGSTKEHDKNAEAVKELRETGALVLAVFLGDYGRQFVESALTDQWIFPMENLTLLKDAIRQQIEEHKTCRFEEFCRFDDPEQQTCSSIWFRPAENDIFCNNTPPASRPCEKIMCEATCAKWKWQKRECRDENNGKKLTIVRGPMPSPPEHEALYTNCRKEKKMVCTTRKKIEWPIEPWVIALITVLVFLVVYFILLAIVIKIRNRKGRPKSGWSMFSAAAPPMNDGTCEATSASLSSGRDKKSIDQGGTKKSSGRPLKKGAMKKGKKKRSDL